MTDELGNETGGESPPEGPVSIVEGAGLTPTETPPEENPPTDGNDPEPDSDPNTETEGDEVSEGDIVKLLERYTKDGVVNTDNMAKQLIHLQKTSDRANTPMTDDQRGEVITSSFEEHQLVWQNDEQRDHYTSWLKEGAFTENQMGMLFAHHAAEQARVFETYGPAPNTEQDAKDFATHSENQVNILRNDPDWSEEKILTIDAFIRKLPDDLKVLGHSAEGFKVAEIFMESKRGPEIIKENSSSIPVEDLQIQLNSIVGDPEYKISPALQKKAQLLGAKIAAASAS